MSVSTFKRHEMKFLLAEAQTDAICGRLGEHMLPDEYCRGGGEYGIYSVYYDTPDSYFIRRSLAGPYYKEKLRLRSYRPGIGPDDEAFLELKKKAGGIVNKRRAAMTLREAEAFVASGKRPAADTYIDAQVISEIAYFLSRREVRPAAYISYRRKAYFGKDDKALRVTFDCDILTRRNDLSLEKESYGKPLLEKGRYLMEVKNSGAIPLWLAGLLAELGLYRAGFSKYGREYMAYSLSRIDPDAGAAGSRVSETRAEPRNGVRLSNQLVEGR